MLHHAEVVLRDGVAVGYVRAGSYGHTLGGAVGLAMVEAPVEVDREYLASGRWEVDVAGVRHAARVSLRPFFDPRSIRVRV
jgi:4-methylaminobutanoate oxidase (formaldehyde-forming)